MLARLHSHLTFANVVSFLALFVALSGGAYALTLPRNSVGTKQLKKGAVTAAKVKDRSLLAKDFRRGQLPAGPTGPSGPPGPSTGPAGGVLAGTYPNPSFDTNVNRLVPLAMVLVGGNGSLASEAHRAPITGPPTVTRTGGGVYTISLPGYAGGTNDIPVCALRTAAGEIVSEVKANGVWEVRTGNSDGTFFMDRAFQCALYDL